MPLWGEALFAGAVAAAVGAVLLWAGPPGNDLPAHVYQRALFLKHGYVLWNNFWYAGRYSFVTYSPLYYPLSALLGIKVLALASVVLAALLFAVVVGREWGSAARWSSRTFGVVWGGTVLSAAFPFALGAALALLALWALQGGRRGRFALLVALTVATSPLAFVFLVVVLLGVAVTRRPRKELSLPALVVAFSALAELALVRVFPDGGRFPFRPFELVPAVCFCVLGALLTSRVRVARPLFGLFVVYLGACVLAFVLPTGLGSNVERLRYLAIPLALLAISVAGSRPLVLAVPLMAVAATWNVSPLIANYRHAVADPTASLAYWQPAIAFVRARLEPSYRVEVVDTLEHWPAVYFPEAEIPIVRGWYRQNDLPANELLYDGRLGPVAYERWLRSLGVRYVVLSKAPPDYSARAEAALLRSGRSGLPIVFRTAQVAVYEVPHAKPVITGPARARVLAMTATRLFLEVGAPGRYRVAVRFSPYLRTLQGCTSRAADGMTRLTAFRAGLVDLDFKMNVHRGLETLTGLEPRRFCHG
jgi:hypothetical protein